MNVLLVCSTSDIYSVDKPLSSPLQMQFGISYISSILKKGGHKTRLAVLGRVLGRKNISMIDGIIKDFQPRLICFTSVSTQLKFIKDIAGYIRRKYPEIFMLIGGPHVSLNHNDDIFGSFDAVCVGEGEYPTLELVRQLEAGSRPSKIQNLWIKKGSDIEKNPTRPFLDDLDSLPFPDRGMWEEWIRHSEKADHSVLLGRGCPFNCTYCSNHALRKISAGAYVRLRSADNIVKEIESIAQRYANNIAQIYLEVETIGTNIEWAKDLCAKLERFNKGMPEPITFGVNLRVVPNPDFRELFDAFRRCNVQVLDIGLESGNEKIRRDVLRRNYSNDDVEKTVKAAREHGLKVHFYNLIGLPGENPSLFKDTVEMNRRCRPDGHATSIFFPYPGTDLYDTCLKMGVINKPIDAEVERTRAVLSFPGFTRAQIQKSYILFDYYVYRGIKPMSKIIYNTIFERFIFSYVLSGQGLKYLYIRVKTPISFLRRLVKKIGAAGGKERKVLVSK